MRGRISFCSFPFLFARKSGIFVTRQDFRTDKIESWDCINMLKNTSKPYIYAEMCMFMPKNIKTSGEEH